MQVSAKSRKPRKVSRTVERRKVLKEREDETLSVRHSGRSSVQKKRCSSTSGSEYHDDTGQTPGATGPGSSRVLKPGSIKDPDPLLKELAQGIGGKYNEVGIDLGLMFKDLQNALETGPSMMLPANQKALQMLNLWRDKTPEMDFTYSILATALEKNGLQRLANKHCYMDHPDI